MLLCYTTGTTFSLIVCISFQDAFLWKTKRNEELLVLRSSVKSASGTVPVGSAY